MEHKRTRKLAIRLAAIALLIGAVVLARIVAIRLDLVPHPDQYQGLAQLSQFHHAHNPSLDALADRLEQDIEIVEIQCEGTLMEMRMSGADDAEPMTVGYRAVYEPLCHFAPKVFMQKIPRGVRVPHTFYEHGDLFVLVHLERRQDPDNIYQKCDSDAFDQPIGSCDVSLGGNWSATYSWEPFCRQGMKDELQCK